MAREKLGRVERGAVAVVAYRLTRGDDSTVEESTEQAPLVYLHGEGQLAPALEKAFDGRDVGAAFEVDVSPEGWVEPSKADGLRVIPRDALPDGVAATKGAELTLSEDGEKFSVWITELGAHRLQVSLAPPWDDSSLKLRGEILKVRPATDGELADGAATRIEPAAAKPTDKPESE